MVWDVEKFLEGKDWHIVIAALFGIGKTSFLKHIAADYASKNLDCPIGIYNYIPVFVSLRGNLFNVFCDEKLDEALEFRVAPYIGKNRKILLICDGLDEYGRGSTDSVTVDSLLNYLEQKHKELKNMKVIITTRLHAGLPKDLDFLTEYVRLLPFDGEQVNEFFQRYYSWKHHLYVLLKSNNMVYKKIYVNPCFIGYLKEFILNLLWMF